MTLEEFSELEPGDKVVFVYRGRLGGWVEETFRAQDAQNGYLIIKEIRGSSVRLEKMLGYSYSWSWLELYEEPNRMWSYERDY
jgi:hypothetical protein